MDEAVAGWANRRVALGGDSYFKPWVLGCSNIPEITDEAKAKEDPELAVLSAVAHGSDTDVAKAVQIALATEAALLGLDSERAMMYRDILELALSEGAQRALRSMNPSRYEYKSEFAKRYYTEGRAEMVLRLLTLRFGALPEGHRARICAASTEELDGIAGRLLSATSLAEAIGPQ